MHDLDVKDAAGCVQFLFESLDELGQQTYLENLAWAAKTTRQQELPPKIVEILQRELKLI